MSDRAIARSRERVLLLQLVALALGHGHAILEPQGHVAHGHLARDGKAAPLPDHRRGNGRLHGRRRFASCRGKEGTLASHPPPPHNQPRGDQLARLSQCMSWSPLRGKLWARPAQLHHQVPKTSACYQKVHRRRPGSLPLETAWYKQAREGHNNCASGCSQR